MTSLNAFSLPQYLLKPIGLHHSNQDYYSPSYWNEKLTEQVSINGGQVFDYEYKYTTHMLTPSKYLWYSPQGTESGVTLMMERTVSLFEQVYNKAHNE